MKVRQSIIFLFAVSALASCGSGASSSTPTISSEPETSSEVSSSEAAPTFEAFTLAQIHEARVAKTLLNLDKKYVAIKGKVTFAKRVNENADALTIQSGKYAIEVNYPEPYSVNVGDSVEVKGQLIHFKVGEVDTISVGTYRSTNPHFDIKVIDEAITTETVTIAKEADLIEYDASLSTIRFSVVGNRTNAAFVGKLSEGDDQFIVANKPTIADKFDEPPYKEGDNVEYNGVFTYSGNSDAKVIRYFDKNGFSSLK